jgi:hypothetical protein
MSIEDSVTKVYFERIFNLGNYENIKIGLEATVSPDEHTPAEVIKALDKAEQRYVRDAYSDRIGAKR